MNQGEYLDKEFCFFMNVKLCMGNVLGGITIDLIGYPMMFHSADLGGYVCICLCVRVCMQKQPAPSVR